MGEVQLYQRDEFGTLRTVTDGGGEVWFVAADVARALGYRDAERLTRRLEADEKGTRRVGTPGGEQRLSVINEPGLYRAVLSSKVPSAKAFQRWVTHDVLPSIRRSGGYMAARPDESPEELMARALRVADETMRRQRAEIDELRPKALFADAVAASDGTCLVGELAKMIYQNGVPIGQNRLFAMLRRDGWLGKSGSHRNVPTQRAMEMGLFRIKETAVTHSDGRVTISRTPKVLGRGQRFFMERYGDPELWGGGAA